MSYGNVIVEIYTLTTTGLVYQHTISPDAVWRVEGTEYISEMGSGTIQFSLLNMTAADKSALQKGRYIHAYMQDTLTPFSQFWITSFFYHDDIPDTTEVPSLTISGPDRFDDLAKYPIQYIISKNYPGTARGTGVNTITLATTEPATQDYYQGWIINVNKPGGGTQNAFIKEYNGSSKVATITDDQWPAGEPSDDTTYGLYGIERALDDLTQLRGLLPYNTWTWNLETTPGTARGTITYANGETVYELLVDIAERTGEFFRPSSQQPTLQMDWRRTVDTSGVTIVDETIYDYNNPDHALALSVKTKTSYAPLTRIHPRAGGYGKNGVIASQATINPATVKAGYILDTSTETPAIANTTLEAAGQRRGIYAFYPQIQPTIDTARAITETANEMVLSVVQQIENGLNHDQRWEVEIITHANLVVGNTVDIDVTISGANSHTVSETGLIIQSIRRVVDQSNPWPTLLLELGKNLKPPLRGDEDAVMRGISRIEKTYRHTSGEASVSGGSGGTGINNQHDHAYLPIAGGHLNGNLTLAENATVDGRDISDDGTTLDAIAPYAHAPVTIASSAPSGALSLVGQALTLNLNSTNLPVHSITGNRHSVTGSAMDIIGLTSSNQLGVLTPSSAPGGASAILKTDTSGKVTIRQLVVSGDYNLDYPLFTAQQHTTSHIGVSFAAVMVGSDAFQYGVKYDQVSIPGADISAYYGEYSSLQLVSSNNDVAAVIGKQQEVVTLPSYTGNIQQVINYFLKAPTYYGSAPIATTQFDIGPVLGANDNALRVQGGQVLLNTTGSPVSNLHMFGTGGGENTYLFFITPNLNRVGIRTVSPLETLHINGSTRSDGNMTLLGSLKTSSGNLTLEPAGKNVLLPNDVDVSGSSWVSGLLGSQWGIDTSAGHADFRSIYADELRVTAFIAEGAFVRAGSQYITKSMASLSRDFQIPGNGGTRTLYVKDIDGIPDTAVFENNDYVLLRIFDRSGGGLVVANVWGQVTNYTNLSAGEQSWTFTARSVGSGIPDQYIRSGSPALDFGQSGDGYIVSTTLDAAGSPYERISTWRGNPYTPANRTAHAQWGNLDGLAGIDREFGFYAGLSPSSARIVASDTRVALHSVPLSMYSGGENAQIFLFSVKLTTNLQASIRPNGDISQSNTASTEGTRYQAINNDSTSSYVVSGNNSQNAEIWLDLGSITSGMSQMAITSYGFIGGETSDGVVLTVQIFKSDSITPLTDELMLLNQDSKDATAAFVSKHFGYVDTAASSLDWNGARMYLRWYYYPGSGETEVIRLDPFVPSIAVGDPLPTAVDVGNGFWVGRHAATGTYRLRVGHETGPKLLWNGASLAIYDSGGNNVIDFAASGNAKINGTLNLGTDGGIWQGTGSFASPTTGIKLWNDGGIGRIAGYNGGTLQAGFDTAGKLTAGGGTVTLGNSGIKLVGEKILIYDESDTTQIGTFGGQLAGGFSNLPSICIGANGGASNAVELVAYNGINYVATLHHAGAALRFFRIEINTSVPLTAYANYLEITAYQKIYPVSTPSNPGASNEVHSYIKGGKVVYQYNNAGTVRYKYLDLTGTGVTWVHTTTAP